MLTFEQKILIIASFPQLQRKDVSLGRVNFHYEGSEYDRKIVVYHLHPNGNGFVYAGYLKGYRTDDKGLVNIRDYSEEALRAIIEASIQSLTGTAKTTGNPNAVLHLAQEITPDAQTSNSTGERWIGPDEQTLLLIHEDEMWQVYTGPHLEMAFESYKEAEIYMNEEGFTKVSK